MKSNTYHKSKLIDILKNTQWKQKDSQNERISFFLNYITKYHTFEKMIDSEGYLYPRGCLDSWRESGKALRFHVRQRLFGSLLSL